MVRLPQSRDWSENWGDEDYKMSRWVWKAVEDKVDKARMAKAEGERTEERKYTKRKKKQLRKPTVEKEIKIARMIKEK